MDNEKYISFDPWWGGFSNVRISYELAIAISIITNRTLILPPKVYCFFLSTHTDKNTFINMWDFFDYDKFSSNIKCVNYEDVIDYRNLESKTQYYDNVESIANCIIFDGNNSKWSPNLAIKQNQILVSTIENQKDFDEFSLNRNIVNLNLNDKYIHFPRNLFGHFYYHVYGRTIQERNVIKDKIKNSMIYKQRYYDIAYKIKEKLGRYNSIHIRRNDFLYVRKSYVDDQSKILLSKLLTTMDVNLPLYIASDETNRSFFDFLKKHYNIFFLENIVDNISDRDSMVVDQLVCSESDIFLGSRLSTYSDYINILRGYSNKKDFHREGTNFKLPTLSYKKYPWEVEPYGWENIHKTCWIDEV